MRGGSCASGRWEANESVAAGLARQAEGGEVPAGADVTGASATPEACGGPAGAAGAGRGRETGVGPAPCVPGLPPLPRPARVPGLGRLVSRGNYTTVPLRWGHQPGVGHQT